MNEQQVKDILFISIIHMVKASREELKRLENEARSTWGELYSLNPNYWVSDIKLQVNAAIANINYCQEKMNETICLN
jgi:hypothetical protein